MTLGPSRAVVYSLSIYDNGGNRFYVRVPSDSAYFIFGQSGIHYYNNADSWSLYIGRFGPGVYSANSVVYSQAYNISHTSSNNSSQFKWCVAIRV